MLNRLWRLLADIAVRIDSGQVSVVKGSLKANVLAGIAAVVHDYQIDNGEIWISAEGRISFSSAIVRSSQQGLRNVIACR